MNYLDQLQLSQVCQEEEKYWYSQKNKINDLVISFKDEIGQDFARERKLEYLKNVVLEEYNEIEKLEDSKKKMGKVFPFDDKLANAKRKYKRLYLDLATLKSGNFEDNKLSQDMIERCRRVPIKDLVGSSPLPAGNGRYRLLCPFHEEKDGSFFVFADNSWHCFGCSAHGLNAIDFIIKYKNVNFMEAVEYLKHF